MAQTEFNICIGDLGIEVGTLWFEANGARQHSTFQYSQSWLSNPRRFAIAPAIALSENRFFFKADDEMSSPLPPPLADASPDSWGRNIIRRQARALSPNATPLNECDYISAIDDFSRIGALRLKDPKTGKFIATNSHSHKHDEIPPLLQLDEMRRIIALVEENDLDGDDHVLLTNLVAAAGSLGGARPKCSVIDKAGILYIAKFTSVRDQMPVEVAEVLTLELARQCGLNTPQATLDKHGKHAVALIKRFDRNDKGRLPYISAQTMLQRPDATSGTYEELAQSIRAYSDNPLRDLNELFMRIAFTILVSNVDDHLKNHGFLYQGKEKWRLSPLFDVNPAPERHKELKTAISAISGTTASIETLIEHSLFFEIIKDKAVAQISHMAEIIATNWRGLASQYGMTNKDINAYRSAFEHDEMTLALKLLKS
ncbi:type II toxin-antitoxin system HipA family toxin [Bartonella sp. HY406]|uniref:type II toxin-antitoxin system HipA family toxin n=1 Tax=Bartonella sp. HY406 TaxID=2979331 RepID=UPI0021C5D1F5|nr:type II toxin-antitoxin system HipA family toxin [Bartonella sp. HY406]UXN05106.1 type II toxin-antitoxin system HipA family toxin [Bartonella sp. HY406]